MKPHMVIITARENLHLAGQRIAQGMGERAAGRPEAAQSYDAARALIEDAIGDLVVLRNALQTIVNGSHNADSGGEAPADGRELSSAGLAEIEAEVDAMTARLARVKAEREHYRERLYLRIRQIEAARAALNADSGGEE